MKNRTSKYIILLSCMISTSILFAQNINQELLRKHIYYLASDKLEGRNPGTKGEKLAIEYLEKEFASYKLIPKGEKGFRQRFTYKQNLNPHDTVVKNTVEKNGTNVIGYLDNGALATLVIGGHFDHLGKGENSSSLDGDAKHQIHNGADDNASGTAGVLELARYFSSNNVKEKYNMLFMCFSAEEDGLIGSKYFTNHPTIELSQINCMINMDMIGRLNDSTMKLMVYGVGTSPGYEKVFGNIKTNFNMVFDSSGVGPSDQTSFYLKNIPVLHFFTGQHKDYHKSGDDADKINYKGEQHVLEYMIKVIEAIDNESRLTFTPTKQNEQQKVSFKVTLGIMPDYSFSGKGVRVDAATEGKPATNAGIMQNDIIVKLGDTVVENIYDYMKILAGFKKGDTTTVEVERNNTIVKTQVTF
jgi:hypothetical protein